MKLLPIIGLNNRKKLSCKKQGENFDLAFGLLLSSCILLAESKLTCLTRIKVSTNLDFFLKRKILQTVFEMSHKKVIVIRHFNFIRL